MSSEQNTEIVPEFGRMFYFVDESGDPNFLGKGKKDLLSTGAASLWFMVGYLELVDHKALTHRFATIRDEIAADEFINVIPSVRHSLRFFHANKDCREVQERVFKALKATEFRFHAVVLRKRIDQYLSKFRGKRECLYAYMVERLLETKLHLHPAIDVYFAKLDSVINETNMRGALEKAKERMLVKYPATKHGAIRIFMQQPHQLAGLQAVDYCLWAIHRVYNHRDFRYYHYLTDKISLVHDLSCGTEYYGTYFNKRKLLTRERFDGE